MQLINTILLLAVSFVYALPAPAGGARGIQAATCKEGDIFNPSCFTPAQTKLITNNNVNGKDAAVADRLAGVAIPKGGVPDGATVIPLTPKAQQAADLGLSYSPDGTLRKVSYTGRGGRR